MALQETGETERIEKRYTRRGQVSILAATCAFIVFETLKEWLFPQLTNWESHLSTIVFVVILGSLATLYLSRILGTHDRASARIRQTNLQHRLA